MPSLIRRSTKRSKFSVTNSHFKDRTKMNSTVNTLGVSDMPSLLSTDNDARIDIPYVLNRKKKSSFSKILAFHQPLLKVSFARLNHQNSLRKSRYRLWERIT